MASKKILLALGLVLTFFAWLLVREFPESSGAFKLFASFAWFTIAYFAFTFLLEPAALSRASDSRSKYTLRKVLGFAYYFVFLFIVISVWIERPETLIVAYGLIGAALALGLQDVLKNLAGGLSILLNKVYKVGDRVQVGDKLGDVIDVDLFYTTLLELGEWTEADMPTGRLILYPNGHVLSKPLVNYTRDHNFMWDEIKLPLTYDSDWRKAEKIALALMRKETKKYAEDADGDIEGLAEKYYLPRKATEPSVFLTLTDNWIDLRIRYVAPVKQRREVHTKLSTLLLSKLEKEKGITIASETTDLTISNMPDFSLGKKKK